MPSAAYILTDHLLSSEGLSCYHLFKNMKRYGYSFEAVSPCVKIEKPLENVNFHQVGYFEILPASNIIEKYVGHMEFIIRSYLESVRVLREREIDVIHHMFPAVYGQSFSLLPLFGKTRGHPFVFGPISAHFYSRPLDETILSLPTSKLHMKTIRKSDRIVAITEQVKKLYSGIVDDERIWVIPIGVDANFFKSSRKQRREEGYELLCVGYLYKLKGLEVLIRSMAVVAEERKDVKLRIVGKGPEKRKLVDLARALHIEGKVVLEGFVPHTRIVEFYQRCDIFCFPTLGEPFGKVVLEAMACAKPVVASNVGGPAEIIKDGRTGFLVPPAQPRALAEKILEVLSDASKMRKIGRNARKEVLQKYAWEKIAETYDRLYGSLA